MRYRGGFPRYVPVAEKRARARRNLASLAGKNPDIRPVEIVGAAIARTWWGKSWNRNLEAYADYANRIGRGRSYVRHGAVLDLQIRACEVRALVQGSRAAPYRVTVEIEGYDADLWERMQETCAGRLGSLSDLLAGRLPRDLADLFTAEGSGLFPSPGEIRFSCSCPDWASMCKHVAATLYGIGARLDEDPLLFFKLRDIDVESLVSEVVTATSRDMVGRSRRKSSRVLDDAAIGDVFGIDVEDVFGEPPGAGVPAPAEAEGPPPRRKKPPAAKKKAPAGKRKRPRAAPAAVKPGKDPAGGKPPARGPGLQELVVEVLGEKGTATVKEIARALKKEKGYRTSSVNFENVLRVFLYRNKDGLFAKAGPGAFVLSGKGPGRAPGKTGRLLEAVESLPPAFRMADLREACPSVSVQRIRHVLGNLRKEGRVACTGRGRAARWEKKGRW